MPLTPLNAISPIDGRYYGALQSLSPYFSQLGLIQYRVRIEVEYFLALTKVLPELKSFTAAKAPALQKIYTEFTEADAAEIKDIEKTTNHDVKAVEYFVKEQFEKLGLESLSREFPSTFQPAFLCA